MTTLISRIPIAAILLLAGCDNGKVAENAAAQVPPIESPLQNTIEGMAKAKAFELEQQRLKARGF